MDVSSDDSVKNGSQESEFSPQAPGLLEIPVSVVDAYTLGIGDHPELSLLSIPLNSKNYLSWSDNILNNLIAKRMRDSSKAIYQNQTRLRLIINFGLRMML